LIHTNRWWDVEVYLAEDPSEEELQTLRDGYVPDVEEDVEFPHTPLEHMLEKIEWQAKRTWKREPVENVDLVLFCGTKEMSV
jgi:hypothetical protein